MESFGHQTEKPISYAYVERGRWNVLDLITIVGGKAIATTIYSDIDMSQVRQLQKKAREKGIHLTVTAILLKAIGLAQKHYPVSRAYQFPWGRMATFEQIVAGFTVEKSVNGQQSVYFGAIDSPETKSYEEIMSEIRQYTAMGVDEHPLLKREEQFSKCPWLLRQLIFRLALWLPQFRMASFPCTFGLSSLGKYGVSLVSGPCVCTSTFGVGTIEDRAVVKEGQLAVLPMMTLVLLYDQRCMDGGNAARFLSHIKSLLEGTTAGLL